jgi:predicted transcriptional regulator
MDERSGKERFHRILFGGTLSPETLAVLYLWMAIRKTFAQKALGPLETRVMEIVWAEGESSVNDMVKRLERSLAYTTVMTTLDRLFKKGLLTRRKLNRAFRYAARLSRTEWSQRRTGEFVADFMSGTQQCGAMLVSCLVDAVGQYDHTLLDELERKVRARRQELRRKA